MFDSTRTYTEEEFEYELMTAVVKDTKFLHDRCLEIMAERDAAYEALRTYGGHRPVCNRETMTANWCSCGYTEELAKCPPLKNPVDCTGGPNVYDALAILNEKKATCK